MKNSTSQFSSFSDMLKTLEQLSEDQQGMLVGGFVSMSGISLPELTEPDNDKCTNNCNGGNCHSTCGVH